MPSVVDIANLHERFAIPGVAEIVAGNGGLPMVHISTPAANADIYLHGAQVTSWRPAGHKEIIFLSQESRWEDGRAIRGGIPVCFPWFRGKTDNAEAPAHGVVRTRTWELISLTQSANAVTVTFSTESDERSRRWWPYEFRLTHRITVGAELKLELIAMNKGALPFAFEEALHTYHLVGDAEKIRVSGLDGTSYLDNMDANHEKTQAGDVILFNATDNAYLNTQNPLELIDPILKRRVRIEKVNSQTTIVWNPWEKGAQALADLGANEWRQMACLEASNILAAAVHLGPGQEHTMTAVMRVDSRP
jgi:glucose-6-phosphate 1-epimerase